ncbi:MAG: hypothetical protein OXT06_17495 [Rhodospirillaceae bacterium]|nr:hypothetical protein [Rhodospirillaceae bacterium]MDD9927779.1 hypothetical protein [Rhodospirillaceae bacterium]
MYVAILIGSILFAIPHPARADIQSDVDSILSDREYQRSLPKFERQEIELPDQAPTEEPTVGNPSPVLKFLLWVLAAVGVVLLAYALLRAVVNYFDRQAQTEGLPMADSALANGKEGSAPPNSLDEIEKLANAGAFSEAVHLLLLKCFEELHRRSIFTSGAAMTSRELLVKAALPAPAQDGLAFIVSAVELGHFGGRQISRATYEQCLSGYRHILASPSP